MTLGGRGCGRKKNGKKMKKVKDKKKKEKRKGKNKLHLKPSRHAYHVVIHVAEEQLQLLSAPSMQAAPHSIVVYRIGVVRIDSLVAQDPFRGPKAALYEKLAVGFFFCIDVLLLVLGMTLATVCMQAMCAAACLADRDQRAVLHG